MFYKKDKIPSLLKACTVHKFVLTRCKVCYVLEVSLYLPTMTRENLKTGKNVPIYQMRTMSEALLITTFLCFGSRVKERSRSKKIKEAKYTELLGNILDNIKNS